MQHIAVCDLILAVTGVFPGAVSIIADGWVFGEFMCILRVCIVHHSLYASGILISVLTTSKAILLKYPLRTRIWSRKHAHISCAVVWVCSLFMPIMALVIDKDDVYFDYRTYSCPYGYSSAAWKFLFPIASVILIIIPNSATLLSSISILFSARKGARRSGGTLRWQGVMTVVLTAAVYYISMLPILIYRFAEKQVVEEQPGTFYRVYPYLSRIAISFTWINIMANFFIYSLTVTSFREFLCARIRLIASNLFCSHTIFNQGRSNYEDNPGITIRRRGEVQSRRNVKQQQTSGRSIEDNPGIRRREEVQSGSNVNQQQTSV